MAHSIILRSITRKTRATLVPLSTIFPTLNPSLKPNNSNNPHIIPSSKSLFCSFPHQSNINQENSSSTPKHARIKTKEKKDKKKPTKKSAIDFTKIDTALLPTVIIVGRPNVGKSALFNRLIGRREALVYNTPDDHVTRDIREGVAKLGDLRFRVLDSAGLETEASSGTILSRTTAMTATVLARAQFALFLIDVRLFRANVDHF